jgi:adenylate cyclase
MDFLLRGKECDAAAAWALVGDTESLNRLADNPKVEMWLKPDEHGFPEVQGVMSGPGPAKHRYREVDSRWVTGVWFEMERFLTGPLLRHTFYRATLEPGPNGGVVPVVQMDIRFSNSVTNAVGGLLAGVGMKRWQAALDALPAPGVAAERSPVRELPRVVLEAIERWQVRGVDADFISRFSAWMRAARTDDLLGIRPFKVADAFGMDRRTVVHALLEGTQAGAVELYWSTRCPRCGAGLAQSESLSDLADHADCSSCRIGIDIEFDRTVEVLFAVHPALRPPDGERFCTLYPVGRPEVGALITLAAEATETITVPLSPGRWTVGGGGDEPDVVLDVGDAGADAVRWQRGEGAKRHAVRAGDVALELVNPTPGRLRIQVSKDPDGGGWVSAAWLSTMPEYRRMFGSQALARDVRLAVRAVAILFTDLTGSAALYHEHGDASAFKLVHEHFGVLDAIVEQFGGARVKSIGDALMVAFFDPTAAIDCALAMQQHFQAWAEDLEMDSPPGLKVGLHFGSAMAVHSDQAGLDYFGGTVNLAARCEGRSERDCVIWTESVQSAPGVAERLERWGGPVEAFDAEVKGIPGPMRLYRARVSTAVSPAGAPAA